MYSLDCSYYTNEFETIEELIEAVMINGMDPNYEVTFNGEGMGENIIDYIVF
tara:strand:+ start:289 stop:444 length:156 start_codon:yes stop_codon:yes gene_type:complete